MRPYFLSPCPKTKASVENFSELANAGERLETLAVTLDNCADEPIHVPGTVQSHGAMLVFDGDGLLEAWSANLGALLLLDVTMGMALQSVALPAPVHRMVEECMALSAGEAIPLSLAVEIGGREFDCVAHTQCGRAIVEFELRDMALGAVGTVQLGRWLRGELAGPGGADVPPPDRPRRPPPTAFPSGASSPR